MSLTDAPEGKNHQTLSFENNSYFFRSVPGNLHNMFFSQSEIFVIKFSFLSALQGLLGCTLEKNIFLWRGRYKRVNLTFREVLNKKKSVKFHTFCPDPLPTPKKCET